MRYIFFEYLDFTDSKDWDKVIEISLQQFTASKKELYTPWMKEMIKHVLNSNIQIQIFLAKYNNINFASL